MIKFNNEIMKKTIILILLSIIFVGETRANQYSDLFKKKLGTIVDSNKVINTYNLTWFEPSDNPWNVKLLDLRNISQNVLSNSTSREYASNSISYGKDDGTSFIDQIPLSNSSIEVNIVFPIDQKMQPGVLFVPSVMENKWAIYFHNEQIIFVRSWLRQVKVKASTIQENNQLIITKIEGQFTEDETTEFTKSVLEFIIHSHVLNEPVPAPIPKELATNLDEAGLWAFSMYGNMADFAHFEDFLEYKKFNLLRTHSLLHLSIAKGDLPMIKKYIKEGFDINSLAGDGLSTLQWAMVTEPNILRYLLETGRNPDLESDEGATAIMSAVQGRTLDHFKVLLEYNADLNKQDHKGFTALHRAAEMGEIEMVKILLKNGANKNIEAEGNTALSLAKDRNHTDIIELLKE